MWPRTPRDIPSPASCNWIVHKSLLLDKNQLHTSPTSGLIPRNALISNWFLRGPHGGPSLTVARRVCGWAAKRRRDRRDEGR